MKIEQFVMAYKTACTAEIAAKIPCTQVLGTYTVTFDR